MKEGREIDGWILHTTKYTVVVYTYRLIPVFLINYIKPGTANTYILLPPFITSVHMQISTVHCVVTQATLCKHVYVVTKSMDSRVIPCENVYKVYTHSMYVYDMQCSNFQLQHVCQLHSLWYVDLDLIAWQIVPPLEHQAVTISLSSYPSPSCGLILVLPAPHLLLHTEHHEALNINNCKIKVLKVVLSVHIYCILSMCTWSPIIFWMKLSNISYVDLVSRVLGR